MRKIVTTCICPPIPTRKYDWAAYYDGDEESGQYGSGATEAEAIADFVENYQDDCDERLNGRGQGRVASTCLETAYGTTVRLSYLIKVF